MRRERALEQARQDFEYDRRLGAVMDRIQRWRTAEDIRGYVMLQ